MISDVVGDPQNSFDLINNVELSLSTYWPFPYLRFLQRFVYHMMRSQCFCFISSKAELRYFFLQNVKLGGHVMQSYLAVHAEREETEYCNAYYDLSLCCIIILWMNTVPNAPCIICNVCVLYHEINACLTSFTRPPVTEINPLCQEFPS